ncbi:MAG: hypothetical protein AAGF77_12755, partial [Bacteroidota bacterium]
NKHHVAIGTSNRNCLWLRPRKTEGYIHIEILTTKDNMEELKTIIETIGQTYNIRKEKILAFALTKSDFDKNKESIESIILKIRDSHK